MLSERTDELFAWTIASPSSAAFLGAFYWGSVVIAATSFPRVEWVRARVGLYGLILFFWVTLAATLIDLDRIHLEAGKTIARVSAWFWLVVYVVIPVYGMFALRVQHRSRGADPPISAPMPPVYRGRLLAAGLILVALGIVLFVAPSVAADFWPWPLTPLTSRAIAAWLLGAGVAILTMWRERDAERVIPGSALIVTVSVLLAISLARFEHEIMWSRGAVYVVALALMFLLGAAGLALARRARRWS